MSYHIQTAATEPPDRHHNVTGDDLEEQQSKHTRRLRTASEDDEAGLPRCVVPAPAPKVEEGPDTIEREQQRKMSIPHHQHDGDDMYRDAELTELAAPAPVAHDGVVDEEPGSPARNQNLQHDEFTSQDSSLTRMEAEKVSENNKATLVYGELCVVSWIIFFSILGTLARLGVEALATYPNAPFSSPVLWANLGGSLFLGFLLEDRRFFRYTVNSPIDSEHHKSAVDSVKKTLPLYIGLATGFCGSFTSFSTFITDAFLALANNLESPSATSAFHTTQGIHSRNGGYSFMAMAGILIVQTAVSLASLKTGAHCAVALEPALPGLPPAVLHRLLDPLSIPLGWGCWLGAVFLSVWPPSEDWRFRATFSIVFAPLGALLRFYLSKHLNTLITGFPLGTFTVNIFGTMVEGMCMDLQHSSRIMARVSGMYAAPCTVLQGVMYGFCGAATTVSTWVAELDGLRRRHAWFYGMASIGVALAFQLVIMGTVIWTVGYDEHCTNK